MKKIILITSIVFFTLNAYSQKVIKKISKEACACLEKIDMNADSTELRKASSDCIANGLLSNLAGLKKELNIDVTSEESLGTVTDPLTAELFKSCPAFVKVATGLSKQTQPKVERGNISNCKAFHLGKFKVMPGYGDTTKYMIFEADMVKEYTSSGELLTTGKCKWINDCTYINTFIESKDPSIGKIFKKGDTLTLEIINIEGNEISYEGEFKGTKFTYKTVKIK
jgi:hypothetical protein